ncbi:MAG: UDP-N-acetylmuramoyl-L-alanyl-D-glutamate--2,6-diaminopimelate ligase [Chloroflexota bacterium]
MPSLASLFDTFPLPIHSPVPNTSITGIAIDSRKVRPGDLFIVLSGPPTDGHRFVPDAIARGAAAVVGSEALEGLAVPYIRVSNSRQAATYLAAAFYGWPGKKLTVIGVTGTDGKTTTANLLYQALRAAGFATGLVSTVNAVIGDEVLDTGFHVTTPDAPDVQRYLARMVAAGLTHVVLETTSHGLSQHRVDASLYDIAAVTNITHEHLNEHGSLANYQAAKARLFRLLAETPQKATACPHLAVLNRDDGSYAFLPDVVRIANDSLPPESRIRSVSYGLTPAADVRAANIRYLPAGIVFDAMGPGFCVPVQSKLVGAFNVSNCLAALAVAVVGLGASPEAAARGIAALEGIPGRMERIDLGQPFTAIVDFAHTPNALKNAIETVRQLTGRRVIVVFGSAGLRDKEKRRMMAEVSAELADLTILTAEDPRTESLDGILAEMAAAAGSRGGVDGETFWRVPDRGDALRFAVSLAQPGDIVMACGKGHEQSMCFGETEYPWDDRTAMRAALAGRLGDTGPAMPYLPTSSQSAVPA